MKAIVRCSMKLRTKVPMVVELLYFEGCPNCRAALDRLKTVLRTEGLPAEILEIQVNDESAAKALKFFESPTIRIDGIDIDPGFRKVAETGFSCRWPSTALPSEEMIRLALREARTRCV